MAPNSLIETLRLRVVVCVIEAIEFMIAIAQKIGAWVLRPPCQSVRAASNSLRAQPLNEPLQATWGVG